MMMNWLRVPRTVVVLLRALGMVAVLSMAIFHGNPLVKPAWEASALRNFEILDQRPVRTKSPMQASHHHHLHSHAHEHARAVERSLHAFALAHVCECAHVQVWAGRILRAHLVCLGMRICAHKPSCTHWRAVLHLCMYMSVRMHIPMSGCARARGQLGSSIHTVGIIRALTQTDTCAQHTWTRLLLTRHLIVHNAECIRIC